jgi:glycosyltransferase involved in cell wall biosynthesis
VIGCLGRFGTDKDQKNFVQAAALAGAKRQDLRFLMVGREVDPGNLELSGWIVATGCADRFILAGQRSDVPECLAAMDLFCLPSRTEGFPNVVAEAMTMALPCVVTDVGDAAMLLGSAGLVVPPGNPQALADGMLRLLALGATEREDLGRQGRERISLEFTIQRMCGRFQAVYAPMLGEGHH